MSDSYQREIGATGKQPLAILLLATTRARGARWLDLRRRAQDALAGRPG